MDVLGGGGRVRTGGDAGMLQPQPRTATPVGPRRPEVAGASALGVSGPCRRLGPCIRRESDVSRSETPRSWRPFAVTAQDSVKQAGQLPAASCKVTWPHQGSPARQLSFLLHLCV